ncbi:hypothetical protein FOQG_08030 [Fusarium oxysporum f. sp. raphani 54005]|uniref:Uncharacterized protein n=2 Tax=Fusarium oxysporum TaxID=5507 RepID=X0C3N0_FUSOX|nr:hypothetical protein FOVG_05712 [Fusarium oxysporum f. sp. pisi HDV247]EXK88731.1 hypothetical protein FOQG_08030 [Fusarium oxysporum f. sp. raphani 54005]
MADTIESLKPFNFIVEFITVLKPKYFEGKNPLCGRFLGVIC